MESTGSAVREFNAYHQYRQQLEADSNGIDPVAPKHHNPATEASNFIRDHLAPTELRQRVRILSYLPQLFAFLKQIFLKSKFINYFFSFSI